MKKLFFALTAMALLAASCVSEIREPEQMSGAWTEGSPLWAVYPFSNEAVRRYRAISCVSRTKSSTPRRSARRSKMGSEVS